MSGRDAVEVAAAAQWGLVTTRQAQAAGVTRTQLNRLAVAGILLRLTHGVYALRSAAADPLLDLRAAWLALDPARLAADRLGDLTCVVVSHASAARLYGYGDLLADHHEFTLPKRQQSRRPELRLHRGTIAPADVRRHQGLPVTTPERTVVDLLTSHHDGEHVAAVLADAVRARMVDVAALGPRLAPFATRFGLPRGNGAAALAHLLELGDVTHEVEADAIAAHARGAGFSTSTYLATVMSDALTAQVAAAPHFERIHAALQAATGSPLQQMLSGMRPLEAQVNEVVRTALAATRENVLDQVRALQVLPQLDEILAAIPTLSAASAEIRAVQEKLRSPAVQAQLAAYRQATS